MSKIYSGYSNFLDASSQKTLHSGAGKVHAILCTTTTSGGSYLTLYDATSADAAKKLIELNPSHYSPIVLIFGPNLPLRFGEGLTAKTGANVSAFIITEQ